MFPAAPARLGWEGENQWRKRQWCPTFQQKESWGSLFHSWATQKSKAGPAPKKWRMADKI